MVTRNGYNSCRYGEVVMYSNNKKTEKLLPWALAKCGADRLGAAALRLRSIDGVFGSPSRNMW